MYFLFRLRYMAILQAPIIIFNDADLECAVNGAAFSAFVASGQTCVSGTRLIVQEDIYDAFVDAFVRKTQGITSRIGDRQSLCQVRCICSLMLLHSDEPCLKHGYCHLRDASPENT